MHTKRLEKFPVVGRDSRRGFDVLLASTGPVPHAGATHVAVVAAGPGVCVVRPEAALCQERDAELEAFPLVSIIVRDLWILLSTVVLCFFFPCSRVTTRLIKTFIHIF